MQNENDPPVLGLIALAAWLGMIALAFVGGAL